MPAGRRYGVSAKVGVRKPCRVKWTPANAEEKGPFKVSTFQEDLAEIVTPTIELEGSPEAEESALVRIVVKPQFEPCSKTIEVQLTSASGYSEQLAFEVSYCVPGSPKKGKPRKDKIKPPATAPVNPAAATPSKLSGGANADAALAVTDSLLNLTRMEIETVRANIEHGRKSPVHGGAYTPTPGFSSAPAGSLQGASGLGMGIGDLQIEFGDDMKGNAPFTGPEADKLRAENARLKAENAQFRQSSAEEKSKNELAGQDYKNPAHQWDFVMVLPTPNKNRNATSIPAAGGFHSIGQIADLVYDKNSEELLGRLKTMGLECSDEVSLKGNLLIKIRAPLNVLKKYAAKIEYNLKLDEGELGLGCRNRIDPNPEP
jgi:hypothetical protein